MASKLIIALLIAVSALMAQSGNYTGWQDTSTILNWKADSLKYGNVTWLGENENKALLCMFNDTNSAAYATDSAKGRYGYQRGFIVINASGKQDTSWRSLVCVDTFSTQAADTAGKWISKSKVTLTDPTTGQETWVSKLMDSSSVTGFAVATAPFSPAYAPLVRPWVQGLTGNRIGGWVKVRLQFQERRYTSVRNQ
jgi:hypothetical protein